MIYILTYNIGSDENKLAQIESEGIAEAQVKAESILSELNSIRGRKHKLIDIQPLNAIRKLDSLD